MSIGSRLGLGFEGGAGGGSRRRGAFHAWAVASFDKGLCQRFCVLIIDQMACGVESALRERYDGALCVDLFGQFGRSELQQREVPMEADQGAPSDR